MPARSHPSKRGSSPAILEMSMPAKSITPRRKRRSIVLSSTPIWSSGVMSALMAPFDALGSVSRQNGTSSTLEATVGLFKPITLNWARGRSCAEAVNEKAIATAANVRVSIGVSSWGNGTPHDRRPVPLAHTRLGRALCARLASPAGRSYARFARHGTLPYLHGARGGRAQVGRRWQRVRRLLRRPWSAALRPRARAARRSGAAPGHARHALGRLARARGAVGRARAAPRAFRRARALHRLGNRSDAARAAPRPRVHRQVEGRALRRSFPRLARRRRRGCDVALRRLAAAGHSALARRRVDSLERGRARAG